MNFLAGENVAVVPRESGAPAQSTVWAEEAIFGHRLWPRQTPWLLFLEFLNVAEAFHRQSPDALFTPFAPDEIHPYRMRYRMGLRSILFNNDQMERIAAGSDDSDRQWTDWIATMDGSGVEGGFEYLRSRFSLFRHFAELVTLIRQTVLENDSERRSSSRFVFPFGVDALYSDAIFKDTGVSTDFNNFGRTGEILYMMASRAARASELRKPFEELLNPDTPKNRLVARLSSPSDATPDREHKGETFLPYLRHPAYDRLVEDWLAIFALGLPEQDAFAHLVPLGTLHVMLYQLETAAALIGRERRPVLVCELIAPKREFVRQRSIISFQENDSLSLRALDHKIDTFVASDAWRSLLAEKIPDRERSERALEMVAREFRYEHDAGLASPADVITGLREEVEGKHEDIGGRVHAAYSRHVGLASARGTNRIRYAPNDALLKTLVVTRVADRMEFKRFLADLYKQYGLVIGETEAREEIPGAGFDAAAFERNRARLEHRLASMGLLQRLSDGCAFVINPFTRNR